MSDNKKDCYGKFNSSAGCGSCSYAASCQYYTRSASGIDRSCSLRSLDRLSDCCEVLIDPAPGPGEESRSRRERMFSIDELAAFLKYLMELDPYTLEILREIISPVSGRKCTVADLCRLHNVSRQSMHRKIFKVIFKHPELKALLRSTLDRMPPRQTA